MPTTQRHPSGACTADNNSSADILQILRQALPIAADKTTHQIPIDWTYLSASKPVVDSLPTDTEVRRYVGYRDVVLDAHST